MTERPLVDVENASKVFKIGAAGLRRNARYLRAVDEVSFTIHRGETLGLVGETGCGKTTLARLVLNLLPLTDGHIRFDGTDVHASSPRDIRLLRRRMQIVFQDPYSCLDPRMTVADIIGEGLRGLTKAQRHERIENLLSRVGLSQGLARRHPHELSGGQRQRVGIARALAVDPDFLILDEPLSALDVSIQSQVLNLLQDLQDQLRLTYLFISHDLAVVRHLADRIAVMYLGRIVEIGSADAIFERPRHPYTEALLSAMPRLRPSMRQRRIVLPSETSSAIDPPAHCRFAPRCARAVERSWKEDPKLVEASEGHWVACFNPLARIANGTARETKGAGVTETEKPARSHRDVADGR